MSEQQCAKTVDFSRLTAFVRKHLSAFYQRRIEALDNLELKKVLARKNPYLFRAVGIQNVSELIQSLLLAYSSSSDETIFGNEFFEPLARDLANGKTADGEGVDVLVETPTKILAYAVKSGTAVFNSSSRRDQEKSFRQMRNRLFKTQKQFDPVVGYSYGRKGRPTKKASSFREIAGQVFWEELTGDPECYVKILLAMKDCSEEHRSEFTNAWERAVNRFSLEFMFNFMSTDGSINWRGLLEYNSGRIAVPWKKPSPQLALSLLAQSAEESESAEEWSVADENSASPENA